MGCATEFDTFAHESVMLNEEANKRQAQEVSRTRQKLRCWAVVAGIFYVICIICNGIARLGTRGSVIDFDSPLTTAHNIRKSPELVRQGIIIQFVLSSSEMMLTIVLTLILLNAGADPVLSFSTAGFRWMQLTVRICNEISIFAALILLDKSMHPTMAVAPVIDFIPTSDDNLSAGEALAFFFVMLHSYGALLSSMFFGISLCLLGAVILRNGIFPTLFGWMMSVAGVSHLLNTLFYFAWTAYFGQLSNVLTAPAVFVELGFAGWLLVKTPNLAHTKDN